MNAVPALTHANPQNEKAVAFWQIKDFPTPTGIINAANHVSDSPSAISEAQNYKPENPPGQSVSAIATQDHDGGISEEVHEIIPGNKFYPAPTSYPVPVVTEIPTITPPVFNPKPTIEPGGCPPCGGGNGKFECVQVVCPL